MAWKNGPLPPGTYGWGRVVKKGDEPNGFFFADFKGDHVRLVPSNERVEPADVGMFDNSLTLPVRRGVVGRANP